MSGNETTMNSDTYYYQTPDKRWWKKEPGSLTVVDMSRAIGCDKRIGNLVAEVGRLRQALAFAKSVILGGEDWTQTCEEVIQGALDSPKIDKI